MAKEKEKTAFGSKAATASSEVINPVIKVSNYIAEDNEVKVSLTYKDGKATKVLLLDPDVAEKFIASLVKKSGYEEFKYGDILAKEKEHRKAMNDKDKMYRDQIYNLEQRLVSRRA